MSRLRERGRSAVSAAEEQWKDHLDSELLRAAFTKYPDAVLVTADDRLPYEHDDVVKDMLATIAVIEPWARVPRAPPATVPPDSSPEEVWKRDVVQRWAHAMASQDSGSVRRYSRDRGARWAPRLRAR